MNKVKGKTKKIIIIFSIVSAITLIFVICGVKFRDSVLYTEDIKDYNSGKYQFGSKIFLEDIPSNLTVVDFSYYSY